jgi:hypothetical protein
MQENAVERKSVKNTRNVIKWPHEHKKRIFKYITSLTLIIVFIIHYANIKIHLFVFVFLLFLNLWSYLYSVVMLLAVTFVFISLCLLYTYVVSLNPFSSIQNILL